MIDRARLDRWLARQEREARKWRDRDPEWFDYAFGKANAFGEARVYLQQPTKKRNARGRTPKVTRRDHPTAATD